jgi:hypothetical protein
MTAAGALVRLVGMLIFAAAFSCSAEEVISGRWEGTAHVPDDELNLIVDLAQENGAWVGSTLDVLIGGGGEKDTTITSSFPIAYSIVCSARAKPGGSYSRAWARAYGHFVFAIRIR